MFINSTLSKEEVKYLVKNTALVALLAAIFAVGFFAGTSSVAEAAKEEAKHAE